jgi:hypothetical protein
LNWPLVLAEPESWPLQMPRETSAAHRGAIAVLLAPWFSRRAVADLVAAFAGTSVPWARLHNLTGRPRSRR